MTIRATRELPVQADAAFATITDVEGLSSWNRIMTATLEAPADVVPGAEWVVEFHALAQTWHSRSTVTDIDRTGRRFAYRAQTDDGNPSFADWDWQVTPRAAGCAVTVTAELHPKTFWRRVLLVHIRRRQLRSELRESLDALATALATSGAP
jgi:uncharacterized protein YndB with AHSA1/START domain